jgi:hypothetical protein
MFYILKKTVHTARAEREKIMVGPEMGQYLLSTKNVNFQTRNVYVRNSRLKLILLQTMYLALFFANLGKISGKARNQNSRVMIMLLLTHSQHILNQNSKPFSSVRDDELKAQFLEMRPKYFGSLIDCNHYFDFELESQLVTNRVPSHLSEGSVDRRFSYPSNCDIRVYI